MGDSLLDVVKGLDKPPPKVPLTIGPNWADQDYVVPTTAEVQREFAELVHLGEIVTTRDFEFPATQSKKELLDILSSVDPERKVAERTTLRRLLRSQKVEVPEHCPTSEMVWLVLTSFRGAP